MEIYQRPISRNCYGSVFFWCDREKIISVHNDMIKFPTSDNVHLENYDILSTMLFYNISHRHRKGYFNAYITSECLIIP